MLALTTWTGSPRHELVTPVKTRKTIKKVPEKNIDLRKRCWRGEPVHAVMVHMQCFFFSPWKSKVPVKAFFGLFSPLFPEGKTPFTHTFFTFFTHSFWFSRTLFCFFMDTFLFSCTLFFSFFSRVRFSFSRALFVFFFTEGKSIFTGKKKHWP